MYWQGSVPGSGQPSNRNSPNLQMQNPGSNSNMNMPVPSPNVGDGSNPANSGTMNISAPQNQFATPNQSQPQSQPTKEFQAAALCRYGQENVQEIIARTQDIFTTLRAAQPPDGKVGMGMDRKPKFQDTLKHIRGLFKRLRVIYDKIEESCPTTENIDTELEKSIPYKDELTTSIDEKRNTEAYLAAYEEYRDLTEQVSAKNRHLREIMDQLRLIIWDVNTMLAMRKEF